MRALALRCVAAAAALALFATMNMLYRFGPPDIYFSILAAWGIEPFFLPYLDTGGNLAAWNCARLGEDVIGFNPCDILGRSFNYGPLWQDFIFIPLYPHHRVLVGTVLNLAFLASLAALPTPDDWRGAWVMSLGATSTAVVFAVERANPDILIFLLIFPVAALMLRGGVVRGAGYGLIWFAAGLKFYPISLLALALRERVWRFLLLAVLSVLLVGLYIVQYQHALARIVPLLPVGNYDSDLFAAKNLPARLGLVAEVAMGSALWGVLTAGGILALLVVRLVRQVRWLFANRDFGGALMVMAPYRHMHLLMGCLLIAGCFFAGQNIAYRAIFLLFALPGLLVLHRRAAWVCVFLMWEGAVRLGLRNAVMALGLDAGHAFLAQLVYWVFRELLWWWAVGVMVAVILQFMWASPVRRAVWRES